MFDLLIQNGTVYDGSGSDPVTTDIGITGDTIVDLGDLSAAESKETIDAAGLTVCPGFIDAHSHSDVYVLIEPGAHSRIFQGITTEVVGNCGASAAPRMRDDALPSDWMAKNPPVWKSVADYRKVVDETEPAVNVALLIGHKALRVAVAGFDDRPVTDEEFAQMSKLLEESLEQGGRGLSTGLIYAPGVFTPPEEIQGLARLVAARNGVYTSHMRSEMGKILDAIGEITAVAEVSGVRAQISHLKVAGKQNWGMIDEVLGTVRDLRDRGIDMKADRYPYLAGCTELDVIFPDWAQEGGRAGTLARLADSGQRAKIRDELKTGRGTEYWGGIRIGSTVHPDNERFRGMWLEDVAAELGLEAPDAVLELTSKDECMTGAFFYGLNEENMLRVLAEPYVMIGSDASVRAPTGPMSDDYPHPRAYGSFPKCLRLSLDGKSVPLAEMIRKMTSLPAEQFGMSDRGLIGKGKRADIVVMDTDKVKDLSDYGDPHQLSTGITHLIVNGRAAIADGELTGVRSGRFV